MDNTLIDKTEGRHQKNSIDEQLFRDSIIATRNTPELDSTLKKDLAKSNSDLISNGTLPGLELDFGDHNTAPDSTAGNGDVKSVLPAKDGLEPTDPELTDKDGGEVVTEDLVSKASGPPDATEQATPPEEAPTNATPEEPAKPRDRQPESNNPDQNSADEIIAS